MSYQAAAHLHYLTIALLLGLLLAELFHLRPTLEPRQARRLIFIDLAYGLSAGLVLTTGLIRLIWFGKGLDYYLANGFFYAKMGLFILVSLLSLWPTFTFLGWRNVLRASQGPQLAARQLGLLRLLVLAELVALGGMIGCAMLMARGYGMF